MAPQILRFSHIPSLWAALACFILLAGCATPFGTGRQGFQLLAPDTLKQPATVLLKLDTQQDDVRQHWEAVLNVDARRIYLVILSPLGQRLATLSFDGQRLKVDHDSLIPIDISIEKLLGELQMIFWPLATLNTDESNKNWHFKEQKHIRRVYYQQQLVAEIRRRPTSAWNGDFDYSSKTSNYRLSVRSSRLDPS